MLTIILCIQWKKRFEYILPMLATATMLLLTGLAMTKRLLWVDALLGISAAASMIWLLWDVLSKKATLQGVGKDLGRYVCTPALLCFVIVAVFYWNVAQPMSVWWRDDLAHWGLQVKSLWFSDGLVSADQLLNARFGDYPPGMAVLQWLGMHINGDWSEPVLYFVLFVTYMVFMLPLLGNVSWKKAYWLIPALAFSISFPTWGNVLSYVFLGIDTALSLGYGYTLVLIWRHQKGDVLNLFAIILGLCAVMLIKQIGVLLAAFACIYFVFGKKERLRTKLLLLIPFMLAGIWMVYCHVGGLSGYNSSGFINTLVSIVKGTYQMPQNADGIWPAFWNALVARYSGDMTFNTQAAVSVPLIVMLIVLPLAACLLGWLCKTQRKQLWLTAALIVIFNVVLSAFIYLGFYTTFYAETAVYTYEHQDNMILLIERYLAPVLLGHGMLIVVQLVDTNAAMNMKKQKWAHIVIAGALAITMVLSTNWALMYEVLQPERYFQNDRSIGSEATVRDQETWGSTLDEIADARVLIDLNATSDYAKELIYSFAPAQFFLSTSDNTASAEALAAYLHDERITQVISLGSESPLALAAMEIMADDEEFYDYTLYDVNDDETVTLTEHW